MKLNLLALCRGCTFRCPCGTSGRRIHHQVVDALLQLLDAPTHVVDTGDDGVAHRLKPLLLQGQRARRLMVTHHTLVSRRSHLITGTRYHGNEASFELYIPFASTDLAPANCARGCLITSATTKATVMHAHTAARMPSAIQLTYFVSSAGSELASAVVAAPVDGALVESACIVLDSLQRSGHPERGLSEGACTHAAQSLHCTSAMCLHGLKPTSKSSIPSMRSRVQPWMLVVHSTAIFFFTTG